MFFVIQKDNSNTVEVAILEEVLGRYSRTHSYVKMSAEDFYITEEDEETFYTETRLRTVDEFDERYKTGIPLGDISFVERYLQIFYGIEYEQAIEVPPILRTDKFLKRKYSIVPPWNIPRTGHYFLKDASRQKQLKYKGDMGVFITDEMYEPKVSRFDASVRFDYSHLYQVSEIVKVISEYRVYVFNGEVNSMSFFAGDPFTYPDAELIKEAIKLYSAQPDSPRSYSLDVMVTDRGTAITEVHNFTSLGLYSVDWDDDLLYAYRDGIDYIINHNVEQTEFSNFSR